MSGEASAIAFRLISSRATTIQDLDLKRRRVRNDRTFAGEATPPNVDFRYAMK
jgi:hypothetical protein